MAAPISAERSAEEFVRSMFENFDTALKKASAKPEREWSENAIGGLRCQDSIPPSVVSGTANDLIGPLAAIANSLRYVLENVPEDKRLGILEQVREGLKTRSDVHSDKAYWPTAAVGEAMDARTSA